MSAQRKSRGSRRFGFFLALSTGLLYQGCEPEGTVKVSATAAPTLAPAAASTTQPTADRVEPSVATIPLNSTLQFRAYLVDRYGKTIDSSTSSSISWSVAPSSLGTCYRGLFRANGLGTGTITAQLSKFSGGALATASLTVTAQASPTSQPSSSPSTSPTATPTIHPTHTPVPTSSVELDIEL